MEQALMHSRPTIGITGPDRGGLSAWLFAGWAVRRAGGRPVHITPSRRDPNRALDAIIIGGGADIDPSLYGDEPQHPFRDVRGMTTSWGQRLWAMLFFPVLYLVRRLFSTKSAARLDPGRDDLEYRYIEYAVSQGLPILGICRGAQLINVYFGGALYQDISDFYTETPAIRSVLPKKEIRIERDSKLFAIIGLQRCKVNALHNQAIREMGQGLRISASEPTGVIQAIEHHQLPFVLGVQWHPEYLPFVPHQRALFQALISAVHQPADSSSLDP